MPIRNPFAKRQEPTIAPTAPSPYQSDDTSKLSAGFERTDTTISKTPSTVPSVSSSKNQDPIEYKLSVVNDSGVYLPPSPPVEKKSFWSTKRNQPVSSSANTNPSAVEIEPFSISRESFDSYRRSFDIGARTPILDSRSSIEQPLNGRQSLDSARMPRLPRSAVNRSFERQPPTAEEGFEDVMLGDDSQKPKEQLKKKSFFSKFNSDGTEESRFHIPGRKRGTSGQGSELGTVPVTRSNNEPSALGLRSEEASQKDGADVQPEKI